ncbi:MAG: YdeI/OmpD-associated family protein [Dehalococcoidia bacterium]
MNEPTFFDSQDAFRTWLMQHHSDVPELIVGFHKKASGRGGLTPPQALEEALCFGWIDGVRRSLGPDAYSNRYTPRTKKSYWSEVNISKYEGLAAAGRVHPAGRAAFEARDPARQAEYSSEAREAGLSDEFERELRAHHDAWKFWSSQPPGYRKTAAFWVMSAKQEPTRKKRLATLIDDSVNGRRIGLLRPGRAANS